MANLYSSNDKSFLTINIIKYEDVSNDWLFIKLIFVLGTKTLLEIAGSFIRMSEFVAFYENVRQLVNYNVKEIESAFLEPNLKIRIEKKEDGQFQVDANFLEIVDYANGKINRKNAKHLLFETKKEKLYAFAEELAAEIKKFG